MVAGMFELSRREQALVAAVLFLFVLGIGVQYLRSSAPFDPAMNQAIQN